MGKRLIDADALEKELNNERERFVALDMKGAEHILVHSALRLLREAPTIDAVPRWIPCEERLPKDLEVVNITWVNHRPVGYYFDIKDKPFTATAIHYRDKWWWYSPVCEDLLAEYGESGCDEMDADIEVTAWMPLPEPYEGERKDND